MKVLIIGAKGFIGQHLRSYLESLKYEVFAADVLVEYADPNYFLIDATNASFNAVFEKKQFDLCVNCSGAASVPASIENPRRDFILNTMNVFKILDAIRKNNPSCKLINLSSAAVYGNPKSLPVKEGDEASPLSPYGYHKHASEKICEEFNRFFDIQVVSLRIFSAFGEGLKKQLFWDLYKKAESSEKVDLFGSGNESRDFIYIGDLVRLIEIVARKSTFKAEVINAANGEEITIRTAVETFFEIWNPTIQANFTGEERKGDPNRWIADVSLVKSMGYQSQYNLVQGLTNYSQWLRKEVEK